MTRILLTGAAGVLGTVLRSGLAQPGRRLRLLDREPLHPAREAEELMTADLADRNALDAACQNVTAVVHFAGQPREADWSTVLRANGDGLVNLYEAARHAGVERFIFASSNHVTGMWKTGVRLDSNSEVRPDSRYAVSKAFGEDLGRLYAYKYGLKGFMIRIGSCLPAPKTRRGLSTWLSHGDLVSLVETGLTADYLYEIVYGVSDNADGWWDNDVAFRLGYRPQDRAEDYAADIPQADPVDFPYQGGKAASKKD